ncbi:hypothetical protein [Paraburkholderia terricola]|uniref:Uncharacterized protein n=1 Tax=Paraburkholderia terricola TaxID=169427 RepID=A0A1M6NMA1_9BURK|nr:MULTISPECIES: hypothetical protein [Paraburkholderia]SDO16185.1 hypothetical protein SAMN05192547_1010159 [Paraburkholderia sediminicola]SHJ96813.1 hypothetical protein SAMN05192548_1010157 [Paraburkholderia terricola]
MTTSAKYLRHCVFVSAWLAMLSAPGVLHAQLMSDSEGLRSAFRSSLLQTTQQKHRRHTSSDPYMALIEQSDPTRRLRVITQNSDPLSQTMRITPSQIALAGSAGLSLGAAGALSNRMVRGSGAGALSGMMPMPGAAPSFGVGAASLSPAAMAGALSAGCSVSVPSMAMTLPGSGPCR